jgi:CheY-like chemotaxis protein
MSKTLLLADDSVVIQKLVGLSFANEDIEIVTTDNGDDAVVKVREINPDVVLADVIMPGKSGYEVCEEIKQDPALAHIPVLLLTGTFEAFDEARATQSGANGQITKPFEAQALVERVNEVMSALAAPASGSASPAIEQPASDYDFFDSDVSTLAAADSTPPQPSSTDQTPAIGIDETPLFGAAGEGATDELDTLGGPLAIGESVAPGSIPDDDATIAILPDSSPPLPPSAGDPLFGFEDDLGFNESAGVPPAAMPSAADLAADLEGALAVDPADAGATMVASLDGTHAATSPNVSDNGRAAVDDAFDDLTIHAPTSAIDNDVAAAPSPAATRDVSFSEQADATAVANLDISLAKPVREATPSSPSSPMSLDLGPSNVSSSELDFSFDISETAPAGDATGPTSDSFSSLMDISESQILGGSSKGEAMELDTGSSDAVADHDIAAGYDVSQSDLATAPPRSPTPAMSEATGGEDEQRVVPGAAANLANAISRSSNPMAARPAEPDLEIGSPTRPPSDEVRVPDLSPMTEQRIQETLEKVAWEAFSDLSESIVKQVIGRVEKIAWEVIPQMAETLVREESRKMKGEKD